MPSDTRKRKLEFLLSQSIYDAKNVYFSMTSAVTMMKKLMSLYLPEWCLKVLWYAERPAKFQNEWKIMNVNHAYFETSRQILE